MYLKEWLKNTDNTEYSQGLEQLTHIVGKKVKWSNQLRK